jgi:glycolate oxidase FAD binding subunit
MSEPFIAQLQERIAAATAARTPQRLRGGGTKDFYGGAPAGDVVDMAAYAGIVAYEPRELVLTVRAGTRVADVEAALAAERQMLPFEPPDFGSTGASTIGGVVATGLSGPRRPYAGAVRDFVLGTRVVNGKGEDLSFGGRVIKNVAGYDVSRLMTGAMGTLGAITEVSFKVLPLPPSETTLAFESGEAEATALVNAWAGKPLPVSATAWQDNVLRVRLAGAQTAVDAARAKLGGEEFAAGREYWRDLRDHRLAFFSASRPLWRISVAQTAAPLDLGAAPLVEWGGGVRWLSAELDPERVRAAAEAAGGHATLFRGGDKSQGVFHPLKPALMKVHRRLKAAFDPAGILNPGRMYDF